MRRYLVLIEKVERNKAQRNYSAFSPDVPGCVATGRTLADVKRNMREAIAFHLEGLAEDGLLPPDSETVAVYVKVAA